MRIHGYVTSRPFCGLVMPVPAQNTCLREYAASMKANYVLPPLEHKFENCYMQLNTVIAALENRDIIAMYSIAMLPKELIKLKEILESVFIKGCSFYFVLEAKSIFDFQTAKELIMNYAIRDYFETQYQPSIELLRTWTKTNA